MAEVRGRRHFTEVPVTFGDADLAGILFFPRIFLFCHAVMESFVEEATGVSYAEWIVERNLGFPTVTTQCDYERPNPFGAKLQAEIWVTRLGTSSVDLAWRFSHDGETTARITSTVVCSTMQPLASTPLTPELRGAFEAYLPEP